MSDYIIYSGYMSDYTQVIGQIICQIIGITRPDIHTSKHILISILSYRSIHDIVTV